MIANSNNKRSKQNNKQNNDKTLKSRSSTLSDKTTLLICGFIRECVPSGDTKNTKTDTNTNDTTNTSTIPSATIPANLVELICKYHGALDITVKKNKQVYGIGLNLCGELGFDHENKVNSLTKLKLFENSPDPNIFVNAYSYVILDKKDDDDSNATSTIAQACGANNYGQLAVAPKIRREEVHTFSKIENNVFSRNNVNVKFISQSVGASHIFFVTDKNELYGCGSNDCGQLGINTISKKEEIPQKVSYSKIFKNEKIKDIRCGVDHAIFLAENGKLFSCGDNSKGQCGLGREIQQTKTIRPIKWDIKDPGQASFTLTNSLSSRDFIISIVNGTLFQQIEKIDCTFYSTFCLDWKGDVWYFGSNQSCVFGIGGYAYHKQYTPRQHGFFKGRPKIVDIRCGAAHVCCLDENGNVYTWGQNKQGQCGADNEIQVLLGNWQITSPSKLKYIEYKIKSIDCGEYHTVLRTINDDLICFGFNNACQCLVKSGKEFVFCPTFISKDSFLPKDCQKLVHVICGCQTTCIIVE